MKTPRNRTAQRSGLYSQSKLSNWSVFDPYQAEISLLRDEVCAPYRLDQAETYIIERSLHPAFIRPFSTQDIVEVFDSMPTEFLTGLRRVLLLGGTKKQELTALGPLFRWGQYQRGVIYLFAYPSRLLTLRWRKPPSREQLIELEYSKPNIRRESNRWLIEFTAEGLRDFYLYDVLLHELGHHVDREKCFLKSKRDSEYYAEWFAERFGRPLRNTR